MRIVLLITSLFCLPFSSFVSADELRVMTYNIHHGEGTDRKFDLERIAKLILAEKPDLVAIQEVDVKTKRASGLDQAAELARLTGMHGRFGKFMDFSGGEYGQMVLSRFPVKKVTNHPLPNGTEPRAALAIEIELPDGTPLTFVGNHLSGSAKQRLAQANELVNLFTKYFATTILAGDFNSEPDDPVTKLLQRHWQNPDADKIVGTWPSSDPEVEIDYIFTPKKSKTTRYEVIDEKVASDHRPLISVIELQK